MVAGKGSTRNQQTKDHNIHQFPLLLSYPLLHDSARNSRNDAYFRMSNSESKTDHLTIPFLLLFLCLPSTFLGLSRDGVFLLSFKNSVLQDPLSVLADWNYEDDSPCLWNGVSCMDFPLLGGENSTSTNVSRVVSLVLSGTQLLGSIPDELGLLEHLRDLDLSGNFLNGTLPLMLFNSSELRTLSLADNEISGELSELLGKLQSLQVLNLSNNALIGNVPKNLTLLPNLTTVILSNNYLSGQLTGGGFKKLETLDLGSNLVNGTLPPDLTGPNLHYLNLSYNRLAGEISPKLLGSMISANVTLDLSFNNFSGEIPPSAAFLTQKETAFLGNQGLCGKPLKNLCTIPSTLSNPPNESSPEGKSPPAFAAIPKSPQGDFPVNTASGADKSHGSTGLKPATIAAIAIGDLGGLGLLFLVIFFVQYIKKERQAREAIEIDKKHEGPPKTKGLRWLSWCVRTKSGDDNETEETSETETEEEGEGKGRKEELRNGQVEQKKQGGILVSVDGETELELEMLLKAPAYILGATGGSIVYKAVLADGMAFAVRRIGDSTSMEKLKEFEAQVRSIAKSRHPNLLPLRCFYWGTDEKLLIHDYASNGSLANIFFSKKISSSPFHLSWETRLRIARGVARGLAYLHEKKCVHGNLKPSNVLLNADMEPMIGDLGIDRLLGNNGESKPGESSARQFGSKRSVLSQGSLPDLSPLGAATSSIISSHSPLPYQAPESLKNLKPNLKWDVYSFGMVLLELITGRVFLEVELMQWNAGFVVEEKNRVLRMTDPALRGEVEGKEDALLTCFRLGFVCASTAPHKRPSMKDAVQVLERVVFSSASFS
ncbi:Receptor protein kinase-like protein [Platanthera guangdongensis]|uniref:Receptor protein kinase-like protein n=1 Tax=Platanthera guangdongensis TaxID=2320717 RepID=A0ABR2M4N8_9ASPA